MIDMAGVSLFAGIEGFGLALTRAGVEVVAAVEIDADCRGVIARHFPQVSLFNDVAEVTADELIAAGFVPWRGILTGGFPCQDLSVAGRRAGLGGTRSGLFWHIMRLADALHPRWIVLENVPGLLSAVCQCPGDEACVANGRTVRCGEWRGDPEHRGWFPNVAHLVPDGACPGGCMAAHGGAMGTVLGALGERGYGFAYRVLDAQHFGVPQRRERVFIVGCLGDRAAPVQVLLEPDSRAGHSAAGPAAGTRVAGTPGSRARGGRTTDFDGHDATGVANAITPGTHGRGTSGHPAENAGHLIPVSVTGDRTHTLRSEGADASGSATGAGVNPPGRRKEDDVNLAAHPLTGGAGVSMAVRRLTPVECERLQGFPTGWTEYQLGADGELAAQSDSARYRQLGNAVPVPVVQWIAERLVRADADL